MILVGPGTLAAILGPGLGLLCVISAVHAVPAD